MCHHRRKKIEVDEKLDFYYYQLNKKQQKESTSTSSNKHLMSTAAVCKCPNCGNISVTSPSRNQHSQVTLVLCTNCQDIQIQLEGLKIIDLQQQVVQPQQTQNDERNHFSITSSRTITTTTAAVSTPQYRFTQSPVNIPEQELKGYFAVSTTTSTTTPQQQASTTTATTNNSTSNNNSMTDEDDFEFGDELNFLINKFDLKDDSAKKTFMPYIF